MKQNNKVISFHNAQAKQVFLSNATLSPVWTIQRFSFSQAFPAAILFLIPAVLVDRMRSKRARYDDFFAMPTTGKASFTGLQLLNG